MDSQYRHAVYWWRPQRWYAVLKLPDAMPKLIFLWRLVRLLLSLPGVTGLWLAPRHCTCRRLRASNA